MARFISSHSIHTATHLRAEPHENFPVDEIPLDLWNVAMPPTELLIQGKVEALSLLHKLPERGLAVVGSRTCQTRSIQMVKNAISSLEGFDLIIVSGLARGIDSQAHLSALEAGLPTIAVLGCGLERSYPEENDPLRQRILDAGGLVISEFPLDAEPKRNHFIRRNRLIAGWTRATWVVEAGFRSGAINTASWAKEQDRYCFVTPCYPGDSTLVGNQRLLETRRVKEGLTRPFWNVRSLGEVWLELESFLAARENRSGGAAKLRQKGIWPGNRVASKRYAVDAWPCPALQAEIERLTLVQGGATLSELIEWSKVQNHSSEEFFQSLRIAQEKGEITLRCGIFSSTQPLAREP